MTVRDFRAGSVAWMAASCVAAATLLWAPLAAADLADFDESLVTTVRVANGAHLTDGELEALAHERGTVELMRYWRGAPLERILVRLGDPGWGCPGFTSMNRVAVEGALAKGVAVVDKQGVPTVRLEGGGAEVVWSLPAAGAPFRAAIALNGKLLYTETRAESTDKDGAPQPERIRVDGANGEVIFQIFTHGGESGTKAADPYAGFGEIDGHPIKAESGHRDPAKAVADRGVTFVANHGFVFDWDSGFWPGGGASPGAFPLQVRLGFGVGWGRGATIQGQFSLDGNTSLLTLGHATGHWWVDYGADLRLDAALNIPFLPPVVIDVDQIIADNVDFIPTFDGRLQRTTTFNSFLLDNGSTMREDSPRRNLFTLDVVDVILAAAGVSLPGWIPLSAGIKLDGNVSLSGTLKTNAIVLGDGPVFTAEGQSQWVRIHNGHYNTHVWPDAHIDLALGLHAYPALFAEILHLRFDLPVGVLSLPVPLGNVGMEFSPVLMSFQGALPDPEPTEEGEVEETPPTEGEATEGGEAPAEGEDPEGEAVEEGEDTEGETGPPGLAAMRCTTFEYVGSAKVLEDMVQVNLPIHVPTAGLVEDLAIGLSIYHNNLSDLVVSLESPAGTRVFLLAQVGGSTAHLLDTKIWDGAPASVRDGVGPFSGSYRAQEALSAFRGENAQGTWQLAVYDAKVTNIGVFNDWSLTINPCDGAPPQPEGEGPLPARIHALDYAPRDGAISLNELLRAVQLYNVGEYHCDDQGEDGFGPGPGWHTCATHSLDYDPANWRISLKELLRAVQLFNSGAYYGDDSGEDGFRPGKAPAN